MIVIFVIALQVDSRRCHPKPCAIGPVYQPSIHPKQPFFVVGAFIFPLRLLEVYKYVVYTFHLLILCKKLYQN